MAQDNDQRFVFFSRFSRYPLVHYLSETAKDYYFYAKESNIIVKKGLDTAESISQPIISKLDEYSRQPLIENIIYSVDFYSCKQLDRVENTAQVLKGTTFDTVEKVAEKIHHTPVESLLIKTVDVVDNIVDSLLPPQDDEEPDAEVLNDPNVVERTAPVFRKLTTRVSKDSIKRLPAQTYNEVKDLVFRNTETIPQVQFCIGLLSTASHKVLDAKESTQQVARKGVKKGAELSKASVDHIYHSLNHLMTVMTSLVAGVTNVNINDAKAALADVYALIQESKQNLVVNNNTVKEDISRILQTAGDILSQQLALGYNLVSHSDYASVRRAASTLELIVNRLLESIPSSSTSPSTSTSFYCFTFRLCLCSSCCQHP